MNIKKKIKKAQSILEYMLLLTAIVAAVFAAIGGFRSAGNSALGDVEGGIAGIVFSHIF